MHDRPEVNIVAAHPFEPGSAGDHPSIHKEAILRDYRIVYLSRQTSIVARREVLSGNAKFGIFGDGKEVAQVAMAHAFKWGDFRSGYYRDQTLMFALGMSSVAEFFAQLYAHADESAEPAFGGRSMTGHFATRLLHPDGSWRDLLAGYNSSADKTGAGFSDRGNEIAFGTIGNASCAEGMFWEALNAAGVLQVPMLLSIWDDGYGNLRAKQTPGDKGDLSKVLGGFQRRPGDKQGIDIYTVPGWRYVELCQVYLAAAE